MMQHKKMDMSGFTLVELLIVLAISTVVLTGVLQVFNTSNKSYSVQEEVAAVQQNLRIGKLFLVRDVRMAGSGLLNFTLLGARVYPLSNTNSEGATGTDLVTIYYEDPANEGCGTPPDPVNDIACDDLPNLTLKGTMPANSAAVPVEEEFSDDPYDKWDGRCYCENEPFGPPPTTAGQIRYKIKITSPDGTRSDSVYVNNILNTGSDDKLVNNAAAVPGALQSNCGAGSDCNKVMNQYPPGSTISFASETTLLKIIYKVQNNVLMRSSSAIETENFQPLADNIEDLQLAFGLDTTADGAVDQWIFDADLTDAQKVQVRLVRISILGRTTNKHQRGSQVYNLEDNTSGGQDGYPRRLLQTTVKVRNLGLL